MGWKAVCLARVFGGMQADRNKCHSRLLVCLSGSGVGPATQNNCNNTAAQVGNGRGTVSGIVGLELGKCLVRKGLFLTTFQRYKGVSWVFGYSCLQHNFIAHCTLQDLE